jgi:hypothetical protein
MQPHDFDKFAQLLDDAYDLIGVGANKIISGGAKSMFFAAMAPYSLATVRAALAAHCVDKVRGRFTPKPADIIEQIEVSAINDGRPGAEEAWAIALRSANEADTVVWTAECAEAFSICRPVLDSSGAISARKPFLEAYARLVAQARAERRPAAWSASIGWDEAGRIAVLKRAAAAGLLPAPAEAVALLAGPEPTEDDPSGELARATVATVKQMLADGAAARQARLDAAHDERIAAEAAEKAALRQRVAAYAAGLGANVSKSADRRAGQDRKGRSGFT